MCLMKPTEGLVAMARPDTKAIVFDCIGVLYEQHFLRSASLNGVLVDFIRTQLRPHYKMAILSNIDQAWMEAFLEKYGLKELFDVVVVSGDEEVAKPHPDIYRLVANRLGAPTFECLFIDDLEENCRGAEAAGMRALRYDTARQCIEQISKNTA